MRDFFCGLDHILLVADVNQPILHKHWAKHIAISLGDRIEATVGGNEIICNGIMINSNVMHGVSCASQRHLVFSFEDISGISREIGRKYLSKNDYYLMDQATVDKVRELFNLYSPVDNVGNYYKFYDGVLDLLGLACGRSGISDGRIVRAVDLIREKKEIDHDIVGEVLGSIHVSRSRLSHLFKEQARISLSSYLAMVKLEKAYKYITDGSSVTDAALMAGFDSASHFAATSRSMIGLSARNMIDNSIFVAV